MFSEIFLVFWIHTTGALWSDFESRFLVRLVFDWRMHQSHWPFLSLQLLPTDFLPAPSSKRFPYDPRARQKSQWQIKYYKIIRTTMTPTQNKLLVGFGKNEKKRWHKVPVSPKYPRKGKKMEKWEWKRKCGPHGWSSFFRKPSKCLDLPQPGAWKKSHKPKQALDRKKEKRQPPWKHTRNWPGINLFGATTPTTGWRQRPGT